MSMDRPQGPQHLAVRPFLAARPGELEPHQARALTEHLSRCPACAAEAAGFHRVAQALAVMREVELEPPAELLDSLVAVATRRRSARVRAARALAYGRDHDTRLVAAAAGAGGALVATAVVARLLRSRRTRGSVPMRLAGARLVPAGVLAATRDAGRRAGRVARVIGPLAAATKAVASAPARVRRQGRAQPAFSAPALGALTARAR